MFKWNTFIKKCIWIYELSNIHIESKQVNKNHFLSCITYLVMKLSRIHDWPLLLLKIVSAQMCCFLKKKQNFWIFKRPNICTEKKRANERHFQSWEIKFWKILLKFKTDCAHFSKLYLLKTIILVKRKKKNLQIFKNTNICNESELSNKNHFLF